MEVVAVVVPLALAMAAAAALELQIHRGGKEKKVGRLGPPVSCCLV